MRADHPAVRAFLRFRTWLDRTLFPESPPPPPLTAARIAVCVLVATAGIVLVLLRIGIADALDSFWAEDGPVLFQVAVTESVPEAMKALWAGYLLLVPRLIAELATLAPTADAAAVFAILAAAVAVGCGFVVWRASAGHIQSPYLRGCLALLVPLTPVSSFEAIGSAAYTPWYLLFALFWVLLWRPVTALRAAAAGGLACATTMSTPLSAVFAPLALLRAVAARDRRDALIAGGFFVGLAIQGTTLALNPGPAPDPAWDGLVWKEYLQRVLGSMVLGLDLGGELWAAAGWGFYALCVAFASVLIALAIRHGSTNARWVAIVCVAASATLFLVSAIARDLGGELAWEAGRYHKFGARYAIVPVMLLFSALFVILDAPAGIGSRTWWAARAAAAALVALAVVTSFDQSDNTLRGTPTWPDALAQARQACRSPDQLATIPISPLGWNVHLPCNRIE